uniref:Uncharacterized protein n=1 Tax=Haemonchus contortus TaxID=6289 RepID=A0A7I4Z0R3_HAECO
MEIMVLVTAAIVVLTVILGCKGKKSEPSPKRPLKSVKQLLTLTKGAKSKRSHANSKGSSDLKTALPIEQSLAVEDTQQDPNKKKSKGEDKKKKKDKKEKEKEKKEKEKKDKKDKKAGHSKLKKGAEVAATQYGEVVQQEEVKKKSGESKEGKAKSKSPKGKSKSPKGGKGSERIISNPIVTPVTDEFPTDEEEGKEMEMNKTKTAADKLIQRKDEQVVDYKKKKTKTGKDRNLSDPIVTPCTDEFPTEEEKPELKEEIQQTHA